MSTNVRTAAAAKAVLMIRASESSRYPTSHSAKAESPVCSGIPSETASRTGRRPQRSCRPNTRCMKWSLMSVSRVGQAIQECDDEDGEARADGLRTHTDSPLTHEDLQRLRRGAGPRDRRCGAGRPAPPACRACVLARSSDFLWRIAAIRSASGISSLACGRAL